MALDVKAAYLPAAHALEHGRSPFPSHEAIAVSRNDAYLYPPLVGWLCVPLTWLPPVAAEIVASALAASAYVAALAVLGVRDWRCYALLMFLPPVLVGVQTANVTAALVLGSALVWRWRSHPRRSGIVLGAMVAAKLMLAPLLIWLLAMKRLRAAGWSVVSALALVLVPWALIGFAGLGSYADLLRLVRSVEGPDSYTLGALFGHTGAWFSLGLGLVALALAWLSAKRDRDAVAFGLSIVSVLLLTPVVWMTYFALLLIPMAARERRFSAWWLVPLAFWLAPGTHNGAPWQTAAALLVAGVMAAYGVLGSKSASIRITTRTDRTRPLPARGH